MSVVTKIFSEPAFSEKEILRYAGVKDADAQTLSLLESCVTEAKSSLRYKVCFTVLPLDIANDVCDFGAFKATSHNLAKNLSGCGSVLLFGATVGALLDRLIAKYGRLSPSRALMMQAIGAERIEALCDAFCAEFERENGVALAPRFSPGYGDLSLDTQKDIFSIIDCNRNIGLTLTDSLLMSPSKSVTAFAGIRR